MPEISAGFKFNADHTFEYTFTYGVVDKWGKGTWKLYRNQLVLKSEKSQPDKDFVLVYSDSSHHDGLIVKIIDSLQLPIPNIDCRLGGVTGVVVRTNDNGEALFPDQNSGLLEMMHPIYGTRISAFDLDSTCNFFLFSPSCDISEVYFKNFKIVVSSDILLVVMLPGIPTNDMVNIRSYKFKKIK
ncbi:hypothetical protein [Solitalea koreensis]|nr:hypothetical protein [Solitalea koreensis]